MSLRPEHEVLLALTARAIGCEVSVPPLDAERWDSLFDIACRQNVAALVSTVIGQDCPFTTRLKFSAIKEKAADQYRSKTNLLVRLLKLFNDAGIDTMFLKGFCNSRHYPNPMLRQFGDIDIYQFGRQNEADALVAKTFGTKINNAAPHHSKYTLGGILVENHYDFIERHTHRGNNAMEQVLKADAAQGFSECTFHGQKCFTPSPTFEVLFMLRHDASHFAADRITLRHLVDWTLTCRHESNLIDWPHVEEVARRFGFLPFAKGMEEICRHYFALTPHLATPDGAADQSIASRMLDEIFIGRFEGHEPPASKPFKRLRFKWRRRIASRWKHDICYSSPANIDFLYSLYAKLLKPHTILH